ncbi:hypothetical protein F4805DRAFT_255278 [Annulohypoxylon moriforme]|nr:hypothetical protein F4805DRAFT_255278 [Annulohypoxylon moriforme]
MSGAEVVGLISSIIAIIDTSLRIYEAIDDVMGLPRSFRDVAARLPLVHNTLEITSKGLFDKEDVPSATPYIALTKVLESCHKKAVALQKALQAVMPTTGASRIERYLKALKTIPTTDKVKNLMNGILEDLQVLTGNHAVKIATQTQSIRLIDGGGPIISLHNISTGSQYVHSGQGNQNITNRGGIQINEEPTVPFYFNRTPV